MSIIRLSIASLTFLALTAALPARADGPAQTPSQAQMKATVRAYFDAMNAGDTAKLKSMFSPDAMIEDPIGTPLRSANDFLDRLSKVKLNFSVAMMTGTNTNTAAAGITLKTGNGQITAIELFTFKPDGKMSSMKAYWGADDRKSDG